MQISRQANESMVTSLTFPGPRWACHQRAQGVLVRGATAEDGKTVLESRIAKCPVCGGDIHIGQRTYNCANYRNESNPCKFSIWRSIGGHNVTVEEAREICEEGITQQTLEFYREDGVLYYKRLALSQQKDRVNMI